jgi:hypothetical protein
MNLEKLATYNLERREYLLSQGNYFMGINRNRKRAGYRKGVDQKCLCRR